MRDREQVRKGARRAVRSHVGVFPDSCNSPAYRISSTTVAFKLRRGAAALSSLLPLTGRFISPEICTDHTSLMASCQRVRGAFWLF